MKSEKFCFHRDKWRLHHQVSSPSGRMLQQVVMFLLVMSQSVSVRASSRRVADVCPASPHCSCPFSNNINCISRNLTAFPSLDTSADLTDFTQLELDSNKISFLSSTRLGHLRNLRKLSLSSNWVVTLGVTPFDETRDLEQIDISKNRLTKVAEHDFKNLRSLRTLDLSVNKIATIADDAFVDQVSLQKLHLDRNELSVVKSKTFSGLSNLDELTLESNRIETIEGGAFSAMTRLKILVLSDNLITNVDSSVFTGLSLLDRLELKKNSISSLTSFPSLPKVTQLDLSGNNINNLVSGQFQNLPNIEELVLDSNTINTIPPDAFDGMTSLKYLSLGHLALSSYDSLDLRSLRSSNGVHLVSLSLDGNGLEALPSGMFSELKTLKMLSMRGNTVGNLTKSSFTGLEKLERLDMSECDISGIEEGAFESMNDLRELLLSKNNLGPNLSQYVLTGLDKLVVLKLDENGISCVRDGTFSGMSLGKLDLKKNQISTLTPWTLQGLSMKLRDNCLEYCVCCSLDLTDNPLVTVSKDAFSSMTWSSSGGSPQTMQLGVTQGDQSGEKSWGEAFTSSSLSGVVVNLAGLSGLPCALTQSAAASVSPDPPPQCTASPANGDLPAEYCGIRPGVTDAPLTAAVSSADTTVWVLVALTLILPLVFFTAILVHCVKVYRKNKAEKDGRRNSSTGLMSETPYPMRGSESRPNTAQTERMRDSIYSATPENNPPSATMPAHVATISAIMRGMERWRRAKRTHPGMSDPNDEAVVDENSLPQFAAKFRQSLVHHQASTSSSPSDGGTESEDLPSRSPSASRRVPSARSALARTPPDAWKHNREVEGDTADNGQQVGPGGGVGFRRPSAVSLAQRGTTITPHGDLDDMEERMTPAFTWRVKKT